ncbi:sigma-70 family RNA polymerase sigma factor [Patescibacteria group bacterium]|nr:sigma-70 family RNA polymerase sigma factor [Patescibacteria group bacterium]
MKNNRDVFIDFYNQYKNKILTYLMYRLNFDRDLSEDLLMDIVLKAYEKFDTFNPKNGSFKNWVFRIAHNHLLNYWRDNKNRKTLSIDDLHDSEELSVDTKSEDVLEKRINMENMQKCFSIMSGTDAEILSLKYIHDFDNKEIAKILKKREGAVRTGLSRAVKNFKELYNKSYNSSNL